MLAIDKGDAKDGGGNADDCRPSRRQREVILLPDANIECAQARRAQLATHEALKDVAHPSVLYAVSTIGYSMGFSDAS